MAAIKDYYGLITIIDYYFDKFYNTGENPITPYNIERYSTIQSFIFDAYKLIKSGREISSELAELYIECLVELEKKILRIENTRLNKFEVLEANSSSIISLVIQLYNKYINRKFDSELPETEQKSGYNDNYRQKIYIGAKLSEKNAVGFDDTNGTALIDGSIVSDYIVIDGTDNSTESGVSFNFYFNNSNNNRYTCNTLEKLKEVNIPTTNNNGTATGGTVGDLIFEQSFKDLENKKYFTYVVFQNGLVVDTYNEYENPIGTCYDALFALEKDFRAIKRRITSEKIPTLSVQGEKDNFLFLGNTEEFLKNYFYKTLVEKYRTNLINDETTKIKTYDLNPQNKFRAIPYIYERLNGRGGLINTAITNGYGTVFTENGQGYIGYNFISSYYDHDTKTLVLNIPASKVGGNLKQISRYKTYDNFISRLSNRYYNAKTKLPFGYINNNEERNDTDYLKNSSVFINDNINDLKSDFLVENFFAIRPYFQPVQKNSIDSKFVNFYRKNRNEFQKDYFYDKDYNTKIDFKFGIVRFIDKELTTVDFNDNSNSYSMECLSIYIPISVESTENINLYGGILYIKRLTQTLADNDITKPVINNTVSRNHELDPNEFITALDDRDFEVVHQNSAEFGNYNGAITNTQLKEGNITKVNFPLYKKTILKKQNGELLLDCTDFSKYNDINTIEQVRLINLSDLLNYNSGRYLFNVKNKKTTYISVNNSTISLETEELAKYNISYFADRTIYLNTESISGKNNSINIKDSEFENFSITGNRIKSTYNSEKFGGITNIVINDELYTNNAEIKPAYRDKITDEYSIKFGNVNNALEETSFYTTDYLVLEENIITKNVLLEGQEIIVEILDFVQSNSVNKKQLEQCIYDNNADKRKYEYLKQQKLYINFDSYDTKEISITKNVKLDPQMINRASFYFKDEITKLLSFDKDEFLKSIILKSIPKFNIGNFDFYYFVPSFNNKRFVEFNENKIFKVYMMDEENLSLDFIIKYIDKDFDRKAVLTIKGGKNGVEEITGLKFDQIIKYNNPTFTSNTFIREKIEKYKDGILEQAGKITVSEIERGKVTLNKFKDRIAEYSVIDNTGIVYTIDRITKEIDELKLSKKIKKEGEPVKEETINVSESFGGLTLVPKQS